jgi:3-deoxy-D-manno-octulosonate 8-phosphate phosphatase (KDO 8-P phosphatase)
MPLPTTDLNERARRVTLLLLDVDGVLTDGTVSISSSGGESKRFHIRDGAAIVWAQRHGLPVGLLSGRPSRATARRATELGIRIVWQVGSDKLTGFNNLLADHGHAAADVAYMADDLMDLPVISRAGLSAAPADAAPEVLERVDWVSKYPGGQGAVREFIEVILRARGSWETVVKGLLG